MEQNEVLEQMRQGIPVPGGSPGHQVMHDLAQEALRLTMELNGRYHPARLTWADPRICLSVPFSPKAHAEAAGVAGLRMGGW